jgi:signal transduction histidine kinase
VARDDRGVTDPGVIRDRFLSEFALALVEGVQLQEFLDWSVAQIGRILDVDRLTLFLFGAGGAADDLVVRASWAADGVDLVPVTIPLSESVVSARLKQFESVVVEDVEDAADLEGGREILRRLGTKSLLAVPIGIDSALRGFVAAASVRERRDWTPDDVAFLESAVHHLSAALKQTELVEELGRERDRLSVLFDLASAVQRSTTVNDVVETALSGLRDTLLFPIGVFSLVAPEGDAVIGLGGYGGTDAGDFSGRIPLTPERPTVSFRVLESGQPLIVNDVEEEPDGPSKERFRQLGARSFGVFPMRSAGKTIGVMSVASRDSSRRIEFDDVETLQSLADFVGVALEQRRTADAITAAMREARSLADASHALLTRTADRRILLDQILDALAQHFGHEACSLLLVDQERHVLVQNGRRGLWWSPVDPVSVIPLDAAGLIPLAARLGRVVNVPDVASEPDYVVGWPDARSELVVPLVLDDRVVGVFDLQSGHPNAFSDADARTIRAFAERAALALRLSELVGTLENRTRVLEAVTRATQLLNFRLHAPDVLTSVVEETTRAFPGADGCVAWVSDTGGTSLSVAAADGLGEMTLRAAGTAPHPLPRLKCAGQAFLENRPVFLQVSGFDELSAGWDPGARARARGAVENPDVRSLMAVPIRVGDHRLGVLEVLAIAGDAFTPGDGETLALLAEQSAIALRNARLIEELQKSNRLKDDFLANLSHEIRTPLTGIVGWAEVLLDSHGDDADARRALEAILGQADTLTRMLGDLIDLSRIDNFGLELRRGPVAIPEILAAALDAVSPGARRRGVVIHCTLDPDLPLVEGDAARLKQVLWNLLANGVKFSPSGGTVHVAGRRASGGGLEIAVEDEGHGIDPEFLPLVFDRFRQEETSSNRRFGGLGIGLAIARAIVLAHGGTIVAESEGRERGSRFVVIFPPERVVALRDEGRQGKREAAR